MAAAFSQTSPVSNEVGLIAELVSQNLAEDGLHLSGDKAAVLLRRLNLIKRRIANLEHEVGAFRAAEQDKATAGVLDGLCLEIMQDGVLDAAKGDPVVYPDFKNRKGK
jgi:hypothetical protein